jgi:hypothetical protein|tara:strand:- start:2540 stop:2689 length:150 start_codon:yes stop_codon:yes gene_type:complete
MSIEAEWFFTISAEFLTPISHYQIQTLNEVHKNLKPTHIKPVLQKANKD